MTVKPRNKAKTSYQVVALDSGCCSLVVVRAAPCRTSSTMTTKHRRRWRPIRHAKRAVDATRRRPNWRASSSSTTDRAAARGSSRRRRRSSRRAAVRSTHTLAAAALAPALSPTLASILSAVVVYVFRYTHIDQSSRKVKVIHTCQDAAAV